MDTGLSKGHTGERKLNRVEGLVKCIMYITDYRILVKRVYKSPGRLRHNTCTGIGTVLFEGLTNPG